MGLARLFIDRLRTERLAALAVALLVLIMAFAAAAAPRLFNRAADAGLRHTIATAQSVERNVQLARIVPEGQLRPQDGFEQVERIGASLKAELPDGVRRIIDEQTTFAESVTWRVPDSPPTRPGYVTVRFQSGLDDLVRMVEGRMPTGDVDRVVPPDPVIGHPDYRAAQFEVALARASAENLGANVGDVVHLLPDNDDPLVGAFGFPEPAAVEVVGIYEVIDPDANVWFDDRSLHEPTLVPVGTEVVLVYATALASPDAFPELLTYVFPQRLTWRHYVDPQMMDAGALERLVVDLRRMESTYASFAGVPGETVTLQSGLLELTEEFRDERRSAEAVLVTAAVGPAALALAALLVLVLLVMTRRRRALILLRGRGGSVPQIVGSHVIEGLLLSVPPAAIGAWLATLALEARPSPWSLPAAGLVALASTLVLLGATLPVALAPLRRLERDDATVTRSSPRRLVFEGLLVGLAVAGVVLLRQRGLTGGSASGDLAGVDPFLAAVPALIGLAVSVVTVRLYPLPVRAAGWIAAGARSLVPALGLRRAERQAGTGHLPLVVLLLTVAIATLSASMMATIDSGQEAATWQSVGAAHRVRITTPLTSDVDLSGLAGVERVAAAHEVDANIGIAGGTPVELVAIDAADFEAVTASTPAETSFPGAFKAGVPDVRPGTTDAPIPAIVSRGLVSESSQRLASGVEFDVEIRSRFATLEVVDVRSSLPGLSPGRPFVVVPRDQLRASLLDRPLLATSLFVRGSSGAADAIRDAFAELPLRWTLSSQADVAAELGDRPLVQAVEVGFVIALAIAIGFAALAVTFSLALAGMARARETAQLRTLGLDSGQVFGLTLLEHGPPVVIALAAGLTLGVIVAWVVLPGLGLAAFTGGAAQPVLVVDAGQLLWLSGVLLAIVALGIGLAVVAQRTISPMRAAREAAQ